MNAFDMAWTFLKAERRPFRFRDQRYKTGRMPRVESTPEVSVPEPEDEGPPLEGRLRAAQLQLDHINRLRLKRGEEEITFPDYLKQSGLYDEYMESDLSQGDFTQEMGDGDAFVPVSDVVKPKRRQEDDDSRFDYVVGR